MSKVNVLILTRPRSHQGYRDDIAAVDPRISARDGTDSFITELRRSGNRSPMANYFVNRMGPGTDEKPPVGQEDLDSLLAQAEVIFGVLLFPDNLLARAPKLKWIHIGGTGIDPYIASGIFDGNVTVTNSRGAVAIPIAEHALTFIMMLAKKAPQLLENKRKRLWEPFNTMEVRNRTVGLIGLGAIGSEIAKLARGCGMRVIATRKSSTQHESGVAGVDELYPGKDLPRLLGESDFVVIAAPLTPETKGMINEQTLHMMKSTAYLINIARGQIVNQPDLIKALREGWIAGAGLDVFEKEPLPPDNEMWQLPNVVMSFHMAGFTDTNHQRVIDLFKNNLRRYLAGEKLFNIVDKQKRY